MNSSSTFVKFRVLFLLLFFLTAVAEAQRPSGTSSSLSDDGDAWGPDGNVNNTVSSSMAIIVIVLVLGFFILGTISIYIQNCGTASSSNETANTSFPTRGSDVVHGLDKSTIDTLPTFEYSAVKELKIGKGSLECAVCLSEFEENETLRLLPKCDHVFHSECIDAWLVGHVTCPVCRADLLQDSTGSESGSDKIDRIANESDHQFSEMSNDVRIPINESEMTNDVVILNHAKIGTLPRSHSTGHSLIQPGENCERFTLKLPPEVRRQLLARIKLKRATSLVALPRQSSSRRGYRIGGGGGGEDSGSSRYGRYFGRSFILRLGSFKSSSISKVAVDGDDTAACTVGKRCLEPIVTTSLEGLPRSHPV